MNITIEVTDNSAEVLAAVENAVKRGLEACGMMARDYAADGAPADTGELKNSMEFQVDGDTMYVGTNSEYGIYQEIGTGIYNGGRQTPWYYPKADGSFGITSGSQPHHMVRDSIANHTGEYEQTIIDSLKNA